MHTRLSIAKMAKWMTMAGLAVAMLASGVTVSAQVNVREPDPSVWLRQVYDLYHRAETDKKAEAQASYRRIVERASKPLAALFKKNDDCEKKSKGICALDWDFVIDGQDFKLTNITVGPLVAKGNTGTVTVSFTNMGTPASTSTPSCGKPVSGRSTISKPRTAKTHPCGSPSSSRTTARPLASAPEGTSGEPRGI